MSIQQRIAAAIVQRYPDALVKKVDQDTYLDIHLPSVHPGRGTHIFFHTTQRGIKIGFYCRAKAFVAAVLQHSTRVESYASGLRLVGNPTYADADAALVAAQEFLAIVSLASSNTPAAAGKADERADDEEVSKERGTSESVTFETPVHPSAELAEVVGAGPTTLNEVVAAVWLYIKTHRLQDPRDLRQINADEKLRAVFGGRESVKTSELTELLKRHLSEVEADENGAVHSDREDVDAILASLGRSEEEEEPSDADGDVETNDAEEQEDTRNDDNAATPESVAAISAMAISPDSAEMVTASADWRVSVWKLLPPDRAAQGEWPGQFIEDRNGMVLHDPLGDSETLALAWSPKGQAIAAGTSDGSVMVLEPGQDWTLGSHHDSVRAVAFSPDGSWLVSGSDDGTARIWDIEGRTERRVLGPHPNWVRSIAVSPDGARLATGCDDGLIRIWRVTDGTCEATLGGQRDCWVTALAWAPDGAWLVSGDQDRDVRIWSTSNYELIRTLSAHSACVRAVAIHHDGSTIASVGDDGVVRLFDSSTGRLQRNLVGASGALNAVAFSPAGAHVIAAGADAVVRVWALASGHIVQTAGHLDLNHRRTAAHLILPEWFSGEVWLNGLSSAEGLSISQGFRGTLELKGLKSGEHLVLPADFRGDLWLSGLKSATELALPQRFEGLLGLGGLQSAEGLTLPAEIGGLLVLPAALRDEIATPSKTSVYWQPARVSGPDDVLEGLTLPDEISEALAEAHPDLTVENLADGRRGGAGLAHLPNYVLSAAATKAICARIRRDRIIPIWTPPELQEHFEPFHKWGKVFWLVPWVVLQNGMNGPVCVELQGLSIPDEDDEFQLGLDIDEVTAIPVPRARAFATTPRTGAKDPRWREWTLVNRDGSEVTFYEYQPDDEAGFHLDIAAAIFEVRWPEIEESRDSPIIVHSPDGVGYRSFDALEEVVAWAMEAQETSDAETPEDLDGDDDAQEEAAEAGLTPMQLVDCPPEVAFFNDLPPMEQVKIVFHAQLVAERVPASEYAGPSLSMKAASVLRFSDALLRAESNVGADVPLVKVVVGIMRGSLTEARSFAYAPEMLDTYTAAECLMHGLVLSLAAGMTKREVISHDYLFSMLERVIVDDLLWDVTVVSAIKFVMLAAVPKFFEDGNMGHVGRAITMIQAILEKGAEEDEDA